MVTTIASLRKLLTFLAVAFLMGTVQVEGEPGVSPCDPDTIPEAPNLEKAESIPSEPFKAMEETVARMRGLAFKEDLTYLALDRNNLKEIVREELFKVYRRAACRTFAKSGRGKPRPYSTPPDEVTYCTRGRVKP